MRLRITSVATSYSSGASDMSRNMSGRALRSVQLPGFVMSWLGQWAATRVSARVMVMFPLTIKGYAPSINTQKTAR